MSDRRAELEREIEYCIRMQNRLAAQAVDRLFDPKESRAWSQLQDRLLAARRELDADPTRRL